MTAINAWRIVKDNTTGGRMVVDQRHNRLTARYISKEDAALISIAPALLSILKHAVDTEEGNWKGHIDEPEWMQQARIAIAKHRRSQ